MITLASFVLGIVLLFAGRRVYWLFVAIIGFLIGLTAASYFFRSESELVVLAIALAAGILGGLLAVVLQRVAGAAAGFLAGSFAAVRIMAPFDVGAGLPTLVPVLIGGVLGALLVIALFDWALILLSVLVGASLLSNLLDPRVQLVQMAFVVLFVLGVMVQGGSLRRERIQEYDKSEHDRDE